jgi:hypothetical protein
MDLCWLVALASLFFSVGLAFGRVLSEKMERKNEHA